MKMHFSSQIHNLLIEKINRGLQYERIRTLPFNLKMLHLLRCNIIFVILTLKNEINANTWMESGPVDRLALHACTYEHKCSSPKNTNCNMRRPPSEEVIQYIYYAASINLSCTRLLETCRMQFHIWIHRTATSVCSPPYFGPQRCPNNVQVAATAVQLSLANRTPFSVCLCVCVCECVYSIVKNPINPFQFLYSTSVGIPATHLSFRIYIWVCIIWRWKPILRWVVLK